MAEEQNDVPVADREPRPPFPKQRQRGPGLESKLDPRPRFEAEAYRLAGKLRDQVALIIGGDSGIGPTVALVYAREGADVAVFLRNKRMLKPSDAGMTPDRGAKFGADSPMGRPAQPEEIAPAYVLLASNADSSYITGIVLQAMGGETSGG